MQAVRIAKLVDRGLIRLKGRDAVKFLQGLSTNNVSHLGETSEDVGTDAAVYSAFLNNKGKVVFDAFVLPNRIVGAKDAPPPTTTSTKVPDVLLDCAKSQLSSILRHLKMYKLRSKTDISDVSNEYEVWAMLPPQDSDENSDSRVHDIFATDATSTSIVHSLTDPRLAALGSRVVVTKAGIESDGSSSTPPLGSGSAASIVSHSAYTAHRMGLGVAEGAELEQKMPLECNLDALNAVAFDKGCYVGQELVARTHYKGVIRKRVMPFVVDHADAAAEVAAKKDADDAQQAESEAEQGEGPSIHVKSSTGDDGTTTTTTTTTTGPKRGRRPPATLMGLADDCSVGIAMVRLEALVDTEKEDGHPLLELELLLSGGEGPDGKRPLHVYRPQWWPTEYRQ